MGLNPQHYEGLHSGTTEALVNRLGQAGQCKQPPLSLNAGGSSRQKGELRQVLFDFLKTALTDKRTCL